MALDACGRALDRDGTIDFDDMVWLPVAHRWATPTYDLIVADRTMHAAEVKRLGRQITPYNEVLWSQTRLGIMVHILLAKYRANPEWAIMLGSKTKNTMCAMNMWEKNVTNTCVRSLANFLMQN